MDKCIQKDITQIMQQSYLNYAMKVIISRALPDVRDGLKPVHRRSLYAMSELKVWSNSITKKSARIVGETMGKYHPHGDSSVYDAMVRLAQEFSLRYPLVIGQGNFGSIDGDGAAAMRYTEAKLSPMGELMLQDIDLNIVDMVRNFDETLWEPSILPSKIPNLLINGTSGIAVGMATNMPPHNLSEVLLAIDKILENSKLSEEELFKIIKAPDFPTGGTIVGKDGVIEAYKTGKGKFFIRGNYTIESIPKGKQLLVINEIPYGVNKPNLMDSIDALSKNGLLPEIENVTDESDRTGIRIVISLRRNTNIDNLVDRLYSQTELETSYNVINLALVDGCPKILSLREILDHYIVYQKDLILRKSIHSLDITEQKIEKLNALLLIGNRMREAVDIIQDSKKEKDAKEKLMETFKLNEVQADYILQMRLRQLTHTELDLVKKELKELNAKSKVLKKLIKSDKDRGSQLRKELNEINLKYGDKRKTKIINKRQVPTKLIMDVDFEPVEDFNKDMSIIVTSLGDIAKFNTKEYTKIKKSYRDKAILVTKIENYSKIGFATKDGCFYSIPFSKISNIDTSNTNILDSITSLFKIPFKNIASILLMNDGEKSFLLFNSIGLVKKINQKELLNCKNGSKIIDVKNGYLISALEDTKEVVLVTKKGMSICFATEDIREMGKTAAGVQSMKLDKDDIIIFASPYSKNLFLITVSEEELIKKTKLSEYPLQKRAGKGVLTMKLKENEYISSCGVVLEKEHFMVKGSNIDVKSIVTTERVGKGSKLNL